MERQKDRTTERQKDRKKNGRKNQKHQSWTFNLTTDTNKQTKKEIETNKSFMFYLRRLYYVDKLFETKIPLSEFKLVDL
jgi:hypothetical protein